MNWTIIIIETIILTAVFTAMILIPLVKNPVWWIADYPEDIQEEYFKTHNVDAFISVRDSIAISFMNTMFDLGKKIPDDIEVIGLQNTKYALLSRPNLTCVDAPAQDIGAASMRLLTKIMKNEEVDQTKVVLPYAIIKRGTN